MSGWLRRAWRLAGHASTAAWLWSIFGATLSAVALRLLSDLYWPWILLTAMGCGCALLAILPHYLADAPSPEASKEGGSSPVDMSRYVATYGGELARRDYRSGKTNSDVDGRVVLWLRPPPDEKIDYTIYCEVRRSWAKDEGWMKSPTVAQTGGPAAPTRSRSDYTIEAPTSFEQTRSSLNDGDYEFAWRSQSGLLSGGSFTIVDGRLGHTY